MRAISKVLWAAAFCAVPSSSAGPIYNAATGHMYDLVNSDSTVSWSQARDLAAASVLNGTSGHLVTVTSPAENEFLLTSFLATGYGSWMGGSDAAQEGVWKWVVGPEAGTTFWIGKSNGTAYGYTYWGGGEPSDGAPSAGSEDYLIMRAQTQMWNDLEPARWDVRQYYVEWDVAPEPTAALMLALAALIAARQPSVTSATWRIVPAGFSQPLT